MANAGHNCKAQPAPIYPAYLLLIPLVTCTLSLIPTTFFRLLSSVDESWLFPSSLPLGLALRAVGASGLVAGHAATCMDKSTLSRVDKCYLVGVSMLTAFFLSVCAAKLGFAFVLLPPVVVSAAGGVLLCGFIELAHGTFGPNGALTMRLAVAAALAGSSCLLCAGVSAQYRLPASLTASACFLFANSILFLLLARARVANLKLLGQLGKAIGSLFLFSANSLAVGYTAPSAIASASGVLDQNIVSLVYTAHPAYSATFLALVGATVYYAATFTSV